MNSATNERQLVIERLIPFFLSVAFYFTLLIPYGSESILAMVVKCAPIICLMYFVVIVGKCPLYSYRILAGLTCCCFGDAFLSWHKYFIHGMLCFMAGHLNYTKAFGFKAIELKMGIFLFALGVIVTYILYSGLSGPLLLGVPTYILVIMLMVWRAVARTQKPVKLGQLSACIGSILFAISDFILGIDKFVQPIAHSQVLIMSSYYAAQLGISLSVLESVHL